MDTLKVYLAGPWKHKVQMAEEKKKFQSVGFDVISTWTELGLDNQEDYDASCKESEALRDMAQIRDADVMVIYNLDKSEGKATELGMALILNKPVILVGERKGNVFYHVSSVIQVKSTTEAIQRMLGRPASSPVEN